MSPDLEKQLVEKYPKIFCGVGKSPKESLMAFGCECGDGWYHIIDDMCYRIQSHINYNNRKIQKRVIREIPLFWLYKINAKIYRFMYKLMRFIFSFEMFKKTIEVDSIPQVVATQIKEKFATLRFYYYGGDDCISKMVLHAEFISGKTCENCGTVENVKVRGKFWIKTLCDSCQHIEF